MARPRQNGGPFASPNGLDGLPRLSIWRLQQARFDGFIIDFHCNPRNPLPILTAHLHRVAGVDLPAA